MVDMKDREIVNGWTYQPVKIVVGDDTHASLNDINNPVYVNVTNTSVPTTPSGTQTITGSVAISGTPNVAVTSLPTISGSVGITGTPVVSLTGTPSVNATVVGTPSVSATISGTPTVSISGTVPVSGTFWQTTQPVSGTVAVSGTTAISAASLPLPSGASTSALQTTANTYLSQIAGMSPARSQIATARLSITASTTETTLISAIASTYCDITHIDIFNTSLLTPTAITLRDSTGGTAKAIYNLGTGDSLSLDFSTMLAQTTANNNWTIQCGTSLAAVVYVNVVYIKNT